MPPTSSHQGAYDFLAKATQNLAAAEVDFASGRYDACANRTYYACFHAAIAALLAEGIRSPSPKDRWGHEYVEGQFVGVLVNRRKRYPVDLRSALAETRLVRERADYQPEALPLHHASRALRRARAFVSAVKEHLP